MAEHFAPPASLRRPPATAVAAAIAELHQNFGNRCITSQAVREQHANHLTWIPNQPPDAVVFPEDADDVVTAIRIAAKHKVPVVPYGTGTSLEGHINAPLGGITIDLAMMKKIIAVHPEDLTATVEPGVTRKQLNEYLRDQGLMFPIDPGADASIGGMTATRASGTNAVRYGTMKDNVLNLKAVLPNGDVLTTARRARKSSAGYDLTRLFVGSEGTLGLITEITVKLHGIPEAVSAAVCSFPTIRDACDATIYAMQSGLPMARIELLDELQVKACNAYSKLTMPETPLLLVEFHGTEKGLAEQVERFAAIAKDCNGGDFQWAHKAEERTKLWQARHDVYWATMGIRPGAKGIATDVCVPISRLADCVDETKRDLDESGLIGPIVGHVGDGNFHVQPLVMMDDEDEVARAKAFLSRLSKRAIAMDGTCTGEHGVGQGKIGYLEAELGPEALTMMRSIKQALDPDNIMNPGKVFFPV